VFGKCLAERFSNNASSTVNCLPVSSH
jgi:hypothetical protein